MSRSALVAIPCKILNVCTSSLASRFLMPDTRSIPRGLAKCEMRRTANRQKRCRRFQTSAISTWDPFPWGVVAFLIEAVVEMNPRIVIQPKGPNPTDLQPHGKGEDSNLYHRSRDKLRVIPQLSFRWVQARLKQSPPWVPKMKERLHPDIQKPQTNVFQWAL